MKKWNIKDKKTKERIDEFMIAIATGIDALDQRIKQQFEANNISDAMIVNYREFLLRTEFDTIIISKKLVGNIEIEYLVLQLKEKDVRIMYLTNKDSEEEIKLCFRYQINDIIVDPIDAKLVVDTYIKPKKFSDVKRLFLQVNSKENNDKSIDIEKLMEIKEKQKEDKLAGSQVLTKNEKMKDIPFIGKQVKKEDTYNDDEEDNETIDENEEDNQNTQEEVKPLTEEDFPKFKKKEVIKETIQETVYKLPNDYKKVIAIISPEPTGKTTLAVNMAWYFSKEHIKTILIDTDIQKKDIYFHFDKSFSGCMSRISEAENVMELGIDINSNLKIFTDNKDNIFEVGQMDIMKLIVSAKNHSQVVVIDVSYNLDEDTIKNILEIADNTIIVVDQKVTTLNRVPEELARYRAQLHDVSIVVNRYYPLKHLEKEQVENEFFKCVELPNGKEFDYKIDKVFTITDDAKSVLQGLANRCPTIEVKNNFITDDIIEICSNYYISSQKSGKKGFWFFK